MKSMRIFSLPIVAHLACAGLSAGRPKAVVMIGPIATMSIQAGQRAPVTIAIHIERGYHLFATKFTAPDLISAHLEFDPSLGISIGKIRYPAGQPRSFPFQAGRELNVYSGDVTVKVMVIVNGGAVPSTRLVRGALICQACSDNAELRPQKLAFSFKVKVTGAPGGGGGGRRK